MKEDRAAARRSEAAHDRKGQWEVAWRRMAVGVPEKGGGWGRVLLGGEDTEGGRGRSVAEAVGASRNPSH